MGLLKKLRNSIIEGNLNVGGGSNGKAGSSNSAGGEREENWKKGGQRQRHGELGGDAAAGKQQQQQQRSTASVGQRLTSSSTPDIFLKPPTTSLSRRKLPSTFGRQVLSKKTTGPNLVFGTSERAVFEKQYISQEIDKCRVGQYGPGPIYEVKVNALGKQVESQTGSAPEIAFAMSKRFSTLRYGSGNPGPGTYSSPSAFGPQVLSYQKTPGSADFSRSTREDQNKIYMSSEFDKVKYGVQSPGPAICDDSSSMGDQITANFKTAPKFRFGLEKRFKYSSANNGCSPGVGKYEVGSSFGKQNESKMKNLPSFSFSQSNRDQRAKVYISSQFDKDHFGEESPGPASVGLKAFPSLGKSQIDSRKPSCLASRFGKSSRFKEYYNDNPGPGNYNC